MDISPVIGVRDKKRGDHPERPHGRELIPAEKLGVDHHRADIHWMQPAQHPLKRADELIRRRVAVAMGQQLPALLESAARTKASTSPSG